MFIHIKTTGLLVILCVSSSPALAEVQLGYFGEHLILAPGSETARAMEKDYPGRLKRKHTSAPSEWRLGNVTIVLPSQVDAVRSTSGPTLTPMPAKIDTPARSELCGAQSENSLTVCLQSDGELPATDREAALQFLKNPSVVLVPTDTGRRTFEHLLAADAALSAQTEVRSLGPSVCSGECTSRIRLLRK